MSAEALLRTPLGELTALPRPPKWFKGNGGKRREGLGEGKRGREQKGGREEKRGKLGD